MEWDRQVREEYWRFSDWHESAGKWYASVTKLMGHLSCSRQTALKFQAVLDLVVLPGKLAPSTTPSETIKPVSADSAHL